VGHSQSLIEEKLCDGCSIENYQCNAGTIYWDEDKAHSKAKRNFIRILLKKGGTYQGFTGCVLYAYLPVPILGVPVLIPFTSTVGQEGEWVKMDVKKGSTLDCVKSSNPTKPPKGGGVIQDLVE
jgi:hypothetical protein